MLIQFTVENHRSIKNSAVISFAASKDKSFEEYLLHPDEKRVLLPALAIYGANAAGKSNVLHAMMTMREMVVGNAAKVSRDKNCRGSHLAEQKKRLPSRWYLFIVEFATHTASLLMPIRFTKNIFIIGRMDVRL